MDSNRDARRTAEFSRMAGVPPAGNAAPPAAPRRPLPDVVIAAVDPNAQAATLGIKNGDVLVSYAGKPIREVSQLGNLVRQRKPDAGDAELVITRANEEIRLVVAPGPIGVTMRLRYAGAP